MTDAIVAPPNMAAQVVANDEAQRIRPTALFVTSQVLTGIGLLFVLFFGWEVLVSALPQHRAQTVLLHEFKAELTQKAQAAAVTTNPSAASGLLGSSGSTAKKAPSFIVAPPPPKAGAPVGLLWIPSIHVNQVVVEGTTAAQLRNGPGHHPNTVMPGQPGNAAISAPRVANGGPFRHLDALHRGNVIQVTTDQGAFQYRVVSVRELHKGNADPLQPSDDNRLTLTTSAPPYRATHALVVTARLLGTPVAPPAGTHPMSSSPSESGFSIQPGALALTVLVFQLLVLATIGARWLYRNWHPATAWVLSTPVLLALLIVFCRSASGLLPATF